MGSGATNKRQMLRQQQPPRATDRGWTTWLDHPLDHSVGKPNVVASHKLCKRKMLKFCSICCAYKKQKDRLSVGVYAICSSRSTDSRPTNRRRVPDTWLIARAKSTDTWHHTAPQFGSPFCQPTTWHSPTFRTLHKVASRGQALDNVEVRLGCPGPAQDCPHAHVEISH